MKASEKKLIVGVAEVLVKEIRLKAVLASSEELASLASALNAVSNTLMAVSLVGTEEDPK